MIYFYKWHHSIDIYSIVFQNFNGKMLHPRDIGMSRIRLQVWPRKDVLKIKYTKMYIKIKR